MGTTEPGGDTGHEQARSAEDVREYVRRNAEGHADQQEEPEENDLGRLPTPPSTGAPQ
jgi:hypothetical protein